MPRPTTKNELTAASEKNFKALIDWIVSVPKPDIKKEFSKGTMNRNIRDVLAHLHHWHLMMQEWYTTGMKGEKPVIPAPGYTWKTVPALNKKIWEQYQTTETEIILKKLHSSHAAMQLIIQQHTDKELFEKQKYKWTGTTSLGAYLVSATSSHYDWALKLMKKALK